MRLLMIALLLGATAPALAQADPILRCAAETDDAARLACYDRVTRAASAEGARLAREREAAAAASAERRRAADAQAAADAARAAAAATAAAEQAKRDAFGADGLADRALRPTRELDALDTAVMNTFLGVSKLRVVVLDNGQAWREITIGSVPPLRTGDRVRVKRGSLGSYLLVMNRLNRQAQVKRIS